MLLKYESLEQYVSKIVNNMIYQLSLNQTSTRYVGFPIISFITDKLYTHTENKSDVEDEYLAITQKQMTTLLSQYLSNH